MHSVWMHEGMRFGGSYEAHGYIVQDTAIDYSMVINRPETRIQEPRYTSSIRHLSQMQHRSGGSDTKPLSDAYEISLLRCL